MKMSLPWSSKRNIAQPKRRNILSGIQLSLPNCCEDCIKYIEKYKEKNVVDFTLYTRREFQTWDDGRIVVPVDTEFTNKQRINSSQCSVLNTTVTIHQSQKKFFSYIDMHHF